MQFETHFDDGRDRIAFDESLSKATIGDQSFNIDWTVQKNGRRLLRIGNRVFKVDNIEMDRSGSLVTFTLNGRHYSVEVKNEQDLLLEKLGFESTVLASIGAIDAPMPGKILDILVSLDQEVEIGDPVIILEAMKMENEIKSPAAGIVSAIHVNTGDSVEKNQPLLEINPSG